MMNNNTNNSNNGSETSSTISGGESGISGFKGGKRSSRRAFTVRPSFSLGDLPERKLKPMTAVTTDLSTGTTSYTVQHQQQQPPEVDVRPSALPPCPARDRCPSDCIDRSSAAAAAANAASATSWHHHHSSATPSSSSVTSHSATNVAPNLYLGGQGDATNATLLRKLRIRRILNVAGEIVPSTPGAQTMTISPKGDGRGEGRNHPMTMLPMMELGIKRVASYGTDSSSSSDSEDSEDEQAAVFEQIQTLHIQLRDHSDEDIASHFEQALKFMRDGVVKGEAVLVHCRFGVSRSATMVLAYLMVYGCGDVPVAPAGKSAVPCSLEANISVESMTYESAFDHVKARRAQISPNLGFVLALHDLEARIQVARDVVVETVEQVAEEETGVPLFGLSSSPMSCRQQQQQFCSPFTVTSSTAGSAVQCN